MVNLGKKILVYGLCSMLASPFMVLPRQAYASVPNKTVFSGGTIYTMTETFKEVQDNAAPHQATVVVVDNTTGKIEKVFKKGEDASEYLNNSSYKQVELGNYVMIPGFMDPHGHFPSAPDYTSINLAPSPIGDVDTLEQLQARLLEKIHVRNYAASGINYVVGYNYDDTLLDIERHPYHEELSKGELGNYVVKIQHISGHLTTVNTKCLARFFEPQYYNSAAFKNIIGLAATDEVTSAKLINENGIVLYQLAYTSADSTSHTQAIHGIMMRADAAQTLAAGPDTVDTYLKCMTGTFVERAANYIIPISGDGYYNDKGYTYSDNEVVSLASKEYASRGVTTANQGGTSLAFLSLRDGNYGLSISQKGFLDNKLKIRTVVQPMVYSYLTPEISPLGMFNHYALAWEGINVDPSIPDEQRSIGRPSSKSPKAGDDISAWYPNELATLLATGNGAMPGAEAAEDTLAHQIYVKQEAGILPKDRIFLGSWKIVYDGSNQGYTGFFGQKGYYQLPDGNETYFPVGRTGVEKDGNVTIDNIGMNSIDDPKNFIEAGRHYGNQGTLMINGTNSFEAGVRTFTRYHEAGQSVHCHMNGSRASSDGATFIELAVASAARKGLDIKDSRHTIIHAQMQELTETQRLLGNYDQYPLNDAQKVQDICTVWQGTATMKWVPDTNQIANSVNGYDPEEGHYDAAFSDEAMQLRADLADGQLMKDQNIISSYFVDHTYYWGQRHRDIFMGPGSAYNMSPMGWAVQLGHRWTLHNDTPITPQNPLKSISIATTLLSSGYTAGGVKGPQEPIYHVGAGKDITATKKFYPTKIDEENNGEQRDYVYFDQRITVLQALHALTVNSAFQTKGLENKLGKIEEGFYADFAILAQDPFELEKQGEAGLLKIADIPVATTLVSGEPVFGVLPGTEAGSFVSNLESSFYNSSDTEITNISEYTEDFSDPATFVAPEDLVDAAKGLGKAYLGHVQFTADVDGDLAVFSVQVMGNDDAAKTLSLHKYITNADIRPFTFLGNGDFDKNAISEQTYWITDRTLEKVLAANDTLEIGKAYYIHFAIENNGDFDLDQDPDKIQDPVIVTADSLPVPPTAAAYYGGGSDGGCTIGNAGYELVFVFFAALGLLAVRIYRKRENA